MIPRHILSADKREKIRVAVRPVMDDHLTAKIRHNRCQIRRRSRPVILETVVEKELFIVFVYAISIPVWRIVVNTKRRKGKLRRMDFPAEHVLPGRASIVLDHKVEFHRLFVDDRHVEHHSDYIGSGHVRARPDHSERCGAIENRRQRIVAAELGRHIP